MQHFVSRIDRGSCLAVAGTIGLAILIGGVLCSDRSPAAEDVASQQAAQSQSDVPWLAEVTQPPTVVPKVDVGRLRPVLETSDGKPIRTRTEWEAGRKALRDEWLKFLGPMPKGLAAPDVVTLRTETVGDEPSRQVIRSLVEYEGEPGVKVQAYLLRPVASVPRKEQPSGQRRRWPAVVGLHQTTNASIDEIAGVSGPEPMQIGLQLAQGGVIVVCPRCFLWQDAASLNAAVEQFRKRHPQTRGMHKMLFDAQRAVDLLLTVPEVDPDRIGAIGHSLGAKEVLYLAAFDDRIRAAVASEGGVTLPSTNWEAPWYLGAEIRQPEFTLNHHQLLALIAPRPFLILGGEQGPGAADGDRSWLLIDAALPAWKLFAAEDSSGRDRVQPGPVRLGLYNHHQGHSLPKPVRDRAYEWLGTYLRPHK